MTERTYLWKSGKTAYMSRPNSKALSIAALVSSFLSLIVYSVTVVFVYLAYIGTGFSDGDVTAALGPVLHVNLENRFGRDTFLLATGSPIFMLIFFGLSFPTLNGANGTKIALWMTLVCVIISGFYLLVLSWLFIAAFFAYGVCLLLYYITLRKQTKPGQLDKLKSE